MAAVLRWLLSGRQRLIDFVLRPVTAAVARPAGAEIAPVHVLRYTHPV